LTFYSLWGTNYYIVVLLITSGGASDKTAKRGILTKQAVAERHVRFYGGNKAGIWLFIGLSVWAVNFKQFHPKGGE